MAIMENLQELGLGLGSQGGCGMGGRPSTCHLPVIYPHTSVDIVCLYQGLALPPPKPAAPLKEKA